MKYFCPMPFINIEARTDSKCNVCCQIHDTIKKPDGTEYNLNHETLTEVWNSEWIKDLRQQFINGEKPEFCYSCWNAEDAGVVSKRKRELKNFPHIQRNIEKGKVYEKPLAMDVKLGNICNNKCRTCSSYASSAWIAEEKVRDGDSNNKWKFMRKLGRWPEDNPTFWEDFNHISTNVKKMEFYGGEPLLIKEHYGVLRKLIETGKSKDIELSYNTNGSIWPSEGLELWKHFKRIMLSFSIDGVGEHFNYIRHPAKFDEVKGHILKLKNLNYDNIYIDICYTVSIYNIFYLDEILEFGKEIGVDVYFNYVYTPYHVSSRNLPQDIKDKIKTKFDGFVNKHPNHIGVNQVATTINYMEDGTFDKKNFKQFITETKFSDDYRGESFSKTFPEYYELFLKSEEFDDEL